MPRKISFTKATAALVSFDAIVIAVMCTLIVVVHEPLVTLLAGVGGSVLSGVAAIVYMRTDIFYD